ncbi:MAG TPA: flagellar filament capping protein FliD [Terracidiphilus sp.]|jgi:flagellar hook-associated protein 2|nr:flagellar filament capping protein FliD [Terracidiphilus sp.]
MGAVGISFGSPTSGAGFNVSATVASIVSNLQNVETPYKNQLTSLQSQDAVLSNLGTLFSNLSNDIGQLTDFQGVLAQKTGSSSNTDVLELTSATSSAVAGTHTVVVNNLAQTSSGFIDPVTNASDSLGGSLTIAVGNGTSQEFDISNLATGDQTLAGLAAAINSSSIGVTASILTDSKGSRLSIVSGTSGAAGELTVTSALTDASQTTTANPTGALNFNGTVDGEDASLIVGGVALTSASNTVSSLIPGVTFQLLAPSASSASGTPAPVQVVIGNFNTGVESAVGTLVSDYNSVISAINAQEGNNSSGTPEPLFGSPTLSLLQEELLGAVNTQNPNGYLDPITNTGDTLAGSITVTVGGGTAKTIAVPNSDSTIAGLASAINSAKIGVTANLVNSSTGTRLVLVSNTAGAGGALTVSSALTDASQITTANPTGALNYNSNSSDISSLTQLGIGVNNDGTLSLDASSLDSLLNTDFSGVVGFFQDANSFGSNFKSVIDNAGTSTPTGILSLAQHSNSTVESNLNAGISREQSLISIQQASLTAELNSANEILQALPSQLNSVNEIYSAITGFNQNRQG